MERQEGGRENKGSQSKYRIGDPKESKDKEIRGEGTARVAKGKRGLWDTRGRKEKRAKRNTGQGPTREKKDKES